MFGSIAPIVPVVFGRGLVVAVGGGSERSAGTAFPPSIVGTESGIGLTAANIATNSITESGGGGTSGGGSGSLLGA